MSHQVPWNKLILEEFIELAMLNPDEERIMRTRVINGWSIRKQSIEFCMSESSINNKISLIKKKYDKVQPYSKYMPVRKSSLSEAYK